METVEFSLFLYVLVTLSQTSIKRLGCILCKATARRIYAPFFTDTYIFWKSTETV